VTGVDIQAARRAAQIRDTGTEDWQAARGLEADIKQVIAAGPLSKSTIGDLVARWGVSRATAWRRIARYQKSGDLTALLKNPRGLTTGASLLPAQVEAVIQQTAHRLWHLAENASLTDIAPVVQRECRARGLTVPSRATIARRLRPLRTDPEYFSGEAKKVLRDRKRLVVGHYDVANALDVVQIDHTVADVHLVDQYTRAPIGRPTLTVAIDIATRCVMGMCLSLEAPSCLLVALCLEHAVFPKMGSPGSPDSGMNWPMYGRMKAIHSDNGKEFHSVAFHRGCDLNGIDVIYRPPATPRFGGHIERLIGTLMRRVRLLPGNTYSDLLKRRARNPESRATMTMSDLHWFMTEEIDRYHRAEHRSLGITPLSAWERAWSRSQGGEKPPVPKRREQFLFDFLPLQRRVVGLEGIQVDGLQFCDPQLAAEIDPGRKRVVRLDPRDLSRIYLERPEGDYLTVPLRRRDLPGMSWWEWRAIRKQSRRAARQGAPQPEKPAILLELEQRPRLTPETELKRRRLASRRAEWQALPRDISGDGRCDALHSATPECGGNCRRPRADRTYHAGCRFAFKTRLFSFHDGTFCLAVSTPVRRRDSRGVPMPTHVV